MWWLVSPGNPLKTEGPAPIDLRLAQARAVMDDPRVVVTDLEKRLGGIERLCHCKAPKFEKTRGMKTKCLHLNKT